MIKSKLRVLFPTRDPARVGIQSTFLDPESEFYPCTASGSGSRGSGSRLGLDPHSGIRNQFDRKSVSAGSSRQPDKVRSPPTSNVQPAGRRPLLGGVLQRCTPGGLPEIRGALPRRRAGSRTPLPGWAPPNWHLGTSPLLAVPSFLLGVLRVTFLAAATQLMRVSSGGLPDIRGALPRRRASSRTPLPGWGRRPTGTSVRLSFWLFLPSCFCRRP
eukprot:SAG25_NODE_11_length_28117_cov_24.264901_3_plen_215_part_00